MANKRSNRLQKKREKQKKKRDSARKERGSRPGLTPSRKALNLSHCVGWPIHEAYLSYDWDHFGASPHAILARKDPETGTVAAALFEVDLEQDGILSAGGRSDLTEPLFNGILAQRSSEGQALMAADPALVVKLVTEAEAHARASGITPPSTYKKAALLFGDIDPADALEEIPIGLEPTEEPVPEPESWMSSLKKRLLG